MEKLDIANPVPTAMLQWSGAASAIWGSERGRCEREAYPLWYRWILDWRSRSGRAARVVVGQPPPSVRPIAGRGIGILQVGLARHPGHDV